MARTPRWNWHTPVDGIGVVELSSWKYFNDFVYQKMLDFRQYIWRGQRCDDWSLESTLDRALSKVARTKQPGVRAQHLDNFKYAVRGRRAAIATPIETENEWWALGQHYGLATPLLDWTTSPFVAAYFAFANEGSPQTRKRAVFAVQPGFFKVHSKKTAQTHTGSDRPPIVEIVKPLSDDNPRLVNQGGLFTRSPETVPLAQWISDNHTNVEKNILIKITIPNKDRNEALRSLNRMNVNHVSLFPDLYVASKFCNLDLKIDKY